MELLTSKVDTLGENDTSHIGTGTLDAAKAILVKEGKLKGTLNSGSTVALGAGAKITGNVIAGTTVALGADAKVTGNLESTHSNVTVGAKGEIAGTTTTAASSATLSAGAFGDDNIDAVTVTMGAGSRVLNDLNATTSTLGATACFGGNNNTTTTYTEGAGAGQCSLDRKVTNTACE
ncbi:MAG: cytoskeletal protein CcmA (bactofilin family) [Gammaproteobacteria bacterium]|jgi:cytoskeletal protein CcmA (bactofilin family)